MNGPDGVATASGACAGGGAPLAPSPRSTLDVLIAARELIADRKRWTRGEYARNRSSHACSPNSKTAVRWCASGAVSRVCADDDLCCTAEETLCRVANASPMTINDDQGHAATIAMFDRAIAAERAKGLQ